MKPEKPLGIKSYGHIPHFPGSQTGPGDYTACLGQVKIATEKARDRHDMVIVQVKLDGSNVGIAKKDGKIIAITRAGYLAETSRYKQHLLFAEWVKLLEDYFSVLLEEGERLCGEWLLQAHGTRYDLTGRQPFVAFDIMRGHKRLCYEEFFNRLSDFFGILEIPPLLHEGSPVQFYQWNINQSFNPVTDEPVIPRKYGELEEPEGFVYRVERKGEVDFLIKYVRPGQQVGKYLPKEEGDPEVWNTWEGSMKWDKLIR